MNAGRFLVLLALAAPVALPLAACAPGADAPPLAELDKTIFAPKCTVPCHSGGPEFAAGGLDLSPDLHKALMGAAVTAPECSGLGLTRVAPGDPAGSLLYRKILAKIDGTAPLCGEPMPLGEDYPPLSDEEAESIRAWISGGALDD